MIACSPRPRPFLELGFLELALLCESAASGVNSSSPKHWTASRGGAASQVLVRVEPARGRRWGADADNPHAAARGTAAGRGSSDWSRTPARASRGAPTVGVHHFGRNARRERWGARSAGSDGEGERRRGPAGEGNPTALSGFRAQGSKQGRACCADSLGQATGSRDVWARMGTSSRPVRAACPRFHGRRRREDRRLDAAGREVEDRPARARFAALSRAAQQTGGESGHPLPEARPRPRWAAALAPTLLVGAHSRNPSSLFELVRFGAPRPVSRAWRCVVMT